MANRRMVTLWLPPAELGVFVAYVVMLCVFVPLHEPWADEAQAWLMSRDLGLFTLVFHVIRHEGHPCTLVRAVVGSHAPACQLFDI